MLSLVLMAVDHRYEHLNSLRSTLSLLLYPLQSLAELPVTSSRAIAGALSDRDDLDTENTKLKKQILLLQGRLQKYDALNAENLRLRTLLHSSLKIEDRMLIAELSAIDLDPYHQQITINKGTASDVFQGQPVLDAQGVMGQVINTNPLTSNVLLITDVSHALPIQVLRNGLRSIAIGTGQINRLEIPYLPGNADIQAGDHLITSGLGGKFPPGYPVAQVIEVNQKPGQIFLEIIAEPFAPLANTREVLLVWSLSSSIESIEEIETLASEAQDK